ncbi:MAG: twitching motility protein PilT [Frankia sp.]
MSLTYDAGALIAGGRRQKRVWALHDEAMAVGVSPIVPAVVLAQAWRADPQPELSRMLKGCSVKPFDEPAARSVGSLLGIAGTSDVIDACVALSAAGSGRAIVTSDPEDLRALAEILGVSVPMFVV